MGIDPTAPTTTTAPTSFPSTRGRGRGRGRGGAPRGRGGRPVMALDNRTTTISVSGEEEGGSSWKDEEALRSHFQVILLLSYSFHGNLLPLLFFDSNYLWLIDLSINLSILSILPLLYIVVWRD